MENEYFVPEELCDINTKYRALGDLVKIFVKLPFGYKII